MPSQLNVDTIVDNAGSGGTNVKIGNTSTYMSDGGAVTQNTVQSLSKMFCNFDGTASGATVRDSFNVSSTDDDGTGDYGINYTNNMGNTNYSGIVVGKQDGAGNNNAIAGTTRTSNDTPTLAASLEIMGTDPDAGADRDYEFVYATSLGDLA